MGFKMNSLKSSLVKNLKPYQNYISDVDLITLRAIIKVSISFIENGHYSKEIYDKYLAKNPVKVRPELFTAATFIIETSLKSWSNKNDLVLALKELKFSEDCIDLFLVLANSHHSLKEHFNEMKMKHMKSLHKLEFRINISLTQSGPTVILHVHHKGFAKTFNLSLNEFHRFRLTIATVLSEVQSIEGRRK